MTTVTNGVNVQGAARTHGEVLKGAPEAAQFTWRALRQVAERRAQPDQGPSSFGLGEEHSHKEVVVVRSRRIPRSSRPKGNGITPIEYLLVGLAKLPDGGYRIRRRRTVGIQRRSVESVVQGGARHPRVSSAPSSDVLRRATTTSRSPSRSTRTCRREDIEALVAQAQKRSARVRRPDEPMNVTVEVALRASSEGHVIERVTAVVIGAGHAGLAASRFLGDRSIDHVALERGEVANSWLTETLAPRCACSPPAGESRLPGLRDAGPDPDGYMTVGEVIRAPSRRFAAVTRAPGPDRRQRHVGAACRRRVLTCTTTRGELSRRAVVIAQRGLQPAVGAAVRRRGAAVRRSKPTPFELPAAPPSSPTAACSSWARRRPACSSPRSSNDPAAR